MLRAAARLPAPGPPVLVHGDLHVRHLLVDDDALLRARVLALFLCAALAAYARDERMASLEREARAGLERALTSAA